MKHKRQKKNIRRSQSPDVVTHQPTFLPDVGRRRATSLPDAATRKLNHPPHTSTKSAPDADALLNVSPFDVPPQLGLSECRVTCS